MPDEMLSPHFARSEASVSASHPELVEPLPDRYLERARLLATSVLEPLRSELARPIRVTSWYRGARLNAAVGGSPTSQHTRAEAADIVVHRLDARKVMRHLMRRAPLLPTGQVILYPDRGFVHVALPSRTYPVPSFHIHWPAKDLHYKRIVGASQLEAYLDTPIDSLVGGG